MVIHIRGTGGAGKSTIVREVMRRYQTKTPEFITGRRRPIGYLCEGHGRLYVPGQYETPTGGCDTIRSLGEAFDVIERAIAKGYDVLFEGIIVQDAIDRIIAIGQDQRTSLLVLNMRVPIEDCIAGIQARRDAKGNDKVLDPKRTISRVRTVESGAKRIEAAGIQSRWVNREEGLAAVIAALGVQAVAAEPPAAVSEPEEEFRLVP